MARAAPQLFRWFVIGLLAAFVFDLRPGAVESTSTSTTFSFQSAALAQGVTICGGCYCEYGAAREQCFAEERARAERENSPRGEITGVCYATYQKWDRDPATGQQVLLTKDAVFTRIRYDELKSFGFNDVSTAWAEYVRTNLEVISASTDGWAWGRTCAALNKPRHQNEVDNWTKAQATTSFRRVFMPTYGVADTPAERALEAKAMAAQKAREAERMRQEELARREADARRLEAERRQAAAEAARRAEIARVEAERQRRVGAIAEQLGPGKRAAAERLQRMNDELQALRPKPRPAASTNQLGPQCEMVMARSSFSGFYSYRNVADAQSKAMSYCTGQGHSNCRILRCSTQTVGGATSHSCSVSWDAGMDKRCKATPASRVTAQ